MNTLEEFLTRELGGDDDFVLQLTEFITSGKKGSLIVTLHSTENVLIPEDNTHSCLSVFSNN